jgi:hypothetical protein
MEYENQQLRRKVASLETENRQIEDELVQEQTANGELTAMLNDAKAMLSRRGLVDDPADPSRLDGATEPPRTMLPAGRSNKKRRKPPFAQIPGRIDTLPPASDDPPDGGGSSVSPPSDDPGPQSRLDRPTPWLPVARGATDPTTPRR